MAKAPNGQLEESDKEMMRNRPDETSLPFVPSSERRD